MSKSTNRYGNITFSSQSALEATVKTPATVSNQQRYLDRVAICLFNKGYFKLADRTRTLLHGIINNWDERDAQVTRFDYKDVLAGREKLAAAKLLGAANAARA